MKSNPKHKLKLAVRKAMRRYYKSGLTNTAAAVRQEVWNAIQRTNLVK